MTSDNNKVRISRNYNKLGAAGVLVCALSVSACSGEASVNGKTGVIDKRSELLLSSDLESVNGTYGVGCTDRSGAWSAEIEPGAALDNDELSVVLNDTGCVLTVTELRTTVGALVAAPAFALTTSYKVSASEFGAPLEFYANAKLNSVSFASDFTLTILYSDDPALAVDDTAATFDEVQAVAAGQSLAAPDYAIDLSTLLYGTDAGDVVTSASGSVGLTAGMVAGQTYVVVDDSGLDTHEELDAAFIAGVPAAIGATVPASAFTLIGDDLTIPQKRTLIFANTQDDVVSYQRFEITFNPAP